MKRKEEEEKKKERKRKKGKTGCTAETGKISSVHCRPKRTNGTSHGSAILIKG